MSEGLEVAIDRASLVASDDKLPSEHVLAVYDEVQERLIEIADQLRPSEDCDMMLLQLGAVAGQAWWKANKSRHEGRFKLVLMKEIRENGGDVDEAARTVLHRLSNALLDPASSPDYRALIKVIGCCFGIDEICNRIESV